MEKVACPGCGAMVQPTTRSLNSTGSKRESIIPAHNPLPKNSKGVSHLTRCPGSETSVVATIKQAVV